jgi:hypothetical protein
VSLIRSDLAHEIDSLRKRLGELDATLALRTEEKAQLKAELDAFRIRYRIDVGLLHEELDELGRQISEAELAFRESGDEGRISPPSPPAPPAEPLPRLTSDAIRKLFRDVAKVVHPDLATDDHTRDRRHALMAEANRAYALGDMERLRAILDAWAGSPEAVQGSDPLAERTRLARRVAETEAQLHAFDDDLARLKETPLWRLKTMVEEAAGQGRDLVADMVKRLKRDILVARNRLDAVSARPAESRRPR